MSMWHHEVQQKRDIVTDLTSNAVVLRKILAIVLQEDGLPLG